jgi:hypothetical protein
LDLEQGGRIIRRGVCARVGEAESGGWAFRASGYVGAVVQLQEENGMEQGAKDFKLAFSVMGLILLAALIVTLLA